MFRKLISYLAVRSAVVIEEKVKLIISGVVYGGQFHTTPKSSFLQFYFAYNYLSSSSSEAELSGKTDDVRSKETADASSVKIQITDIVLCLS